MKRKENESELTITLDEFMNLKDGKDEGWSALDGHLYCRIGSKVALSKKIELGFRIFSIFERCPIELDINNSKEFFSNELGAVVDTIPIAHLILRKVTIVD